MTSEELEDRLIDFAINCIKMIEKSTNTFAAEHMSKQLIRSSTSAPLNYSETISAQSYRDYIHKMQIVLRELRESKTNLRIQKGAELNKDIKKLDVLIDESDQLIKIFSKSIITSKKRNRNRNKS